MNNQFLINLADELNACPTREEKIETLIFYGKQLSMQPLAYFNEIDKVKGCTSETYLKITIEPDTNIVTMASFSDSLIVKGYLYILSEAYVNQSKSTILDTIDAEIKEFIQTAHIDESIMPSRTNTILNLVIHIKEILNHS